MTDALDCLLKRLICRTPGRFLKAQNEATFGRDVVAVRFRGEADLAIYRGDDAGMAEVVFCEDERGFRRFETRLQLQFCGAGGVKLRTGGHPFRKKFFLTCKDEVGKLKFGLELPYLRDMIAHGGGKARIVKAVQELSLILDSQASG